MKITILPVLLMAIIQGCATAFHPAGYTGGYSEVRLEENMFKVTFRGNRFTDVDRAKDFVLLRSAELTIESGYKYFAVTALYEYSADGYQAYPTVFYSAAGAYGDRNIRATVTSGENGYTVTKPRIAADIVCFLEKQRDTAYDTLIVRDSVMAKYNLK